MTRFWLLACAALAGCPAPPKRAPAPPLEQNRAAGEGQRNLIGELQDQILKSYERDEPPEFENAMVPAEVGTIRIGVGPGDILLGPELARAPSRWPLDLDAGTPSEPRSKRLEVHLSQDRQAGWASDEISLRIAVCGRIAVIPLRFSALFALDGDRWVPVFEHLSFSHAPVPTREGQKLPRAIPTAVSNRDLADELTRVLSPLLRRALDKSSKSIASDTVLYGPGVAAEWHGVDAVGVALMAGSTPMRLEDRLVGVVGRNPKTATVAYWAGNLTADLPARPGVPAGRGHFRATFVFEKRQGDWVVVQGQVSQPIDDDSLANAVFGTALISPKPLAISCDERPRPPAKTR